jgi:hypothetical protein
MFNYKNKFIEDQNQVIKELPKFSQINVIDLSDNELKSVDLSDFPSYITNINLENNDLENICWDDREWGTLRLTKNSIDFEQIHNLRCKRLDLSDNKMCEDIIFINCKIDELNLSDNKINSVNFIDCEVRKLNISSNKIFEINHFPDGIMIFNATNNHIEKICTIPDSIMILELSDNLLSSIPNYPINLTKLDLSKNRFKTINIEDIPETIDFFDITNNLITNTDEFFEPLKDRVDELYYDDDPVVNPVIDPKPETKPVDSNEESKNTQTTSESTSSTEPSKQNSTQVEVEVKAKEDSDSDADSEISIKVMRIPRNKEVCSDNESDHFDIPDLDDVESEFEKMNNSVKKVNVSETSETSSDSSDCSDSDDDIGQTIAKFRRCVESKNSNDKVNQKELENDLEKRRQMAFNAALLRAKLQQDSETNSQPQNIEVVMSEQNRQLLELMGMYRSNSNNTKKTHVYSSKVNVECKWHFVL